MLNCHHLSVNSHISCSICSAQTIPSLYFFSEQRFQEMATKQISVGIESLVKNTSFAETSVNELIDFLISKLKPAEKDSLFVSIAFLFTEKL